jgi:hypothetical protein
MSMTKEEITEIDREKFNRMTKKEQLEQYLRRVEKMEQIGVEMVGDVAGFLLGWSNSEARPADDREMFATTAKMLIGALQMIEGANHHRWNALGGRPEGSADKH